MGRIYDNWGRLVEAVMRREQLKQLSLASSSTTSFDSDFSSTSSSYRYSDSYFTPSPHALSLKLAQIATRDKKPSASAKAPAKRQNLLKGGLSIFSNFYTNKAYAKEERGVGWANGQRTFHGHEPRKIHSLKTDSQIAQEAKKKAEFERLQELHTLKGHIEALAKAKGLDGNSVNHYYTV